MKKRNGMKNKKKKNKWFDGSSQGALLQAERGGKN